MEIIVKKRILVLFALGFMIPPLGWLFINLYSGICKNFNELLRIILSPFLWIYVLGYIAAILFLVNKKINTIIDYIKFPSEDKIVNTQKTINSIPKIFLYGIVIYCIIGPNTGLIVALDIIDPVEYILSELFGIPFIILFGVSFFIPITYNTEILSQNIPLDKNNKFLSVNNKLMIVIISNILGSMLILGLFSITLRLNELSLYDFILKIIVIILISCFICITNVLLLKNQIMKPINFITESLKNISEVDGDLTKQINIPNRDELGFLASSFNKFSENIKDIINNIQNSSINLASSASELSTSSTQINQTFDNLAEKINDSVTSITEISQSIKQVSENSVRVSDQANLTIEVAKKGHQKTKESRASLELVQSDMGLAKNKLNDLNNASNEIGKILKIIIDIADKTDMLAINASIEAASAGEYGKGFMVVADEVRRLADRSSSSAQEIEFTINKLLYGIQEIYKTVESSYNGVLKSHEVSTFAGQALEEVVTAFEATVKLVKQISYATQQQSLGSEEITKSIEDISHSSKESAQALSQMSELASQLHSLSEALLGLTEKFKIE